MLDRLGQNWTALDIETALCLDFGYQRHQKDDRRVLQFMIGLDSCCLGFLSYQPGDKPGAKESDHQAI